MGDAFVASFCRTAIGKFDGSLAHVPSYSLAEAVIRESVSRANLPSEAVEEVILGQYRTKREGKPEM